MNLSKLLIPSWNWTRLKPGDAGDISASTDIYKVMKYGSSGIVCLPEGLEVSQLVRVIIEYLNEHPKDLNRPAFMLITNALAETFPCPQTQLLPQSPK